MLTKKRIEKAIKEKTGWEVHIGGDGSDGCYYFYQDEIGPLLMVSTTVYVCRLNHLSLEKWIEEFEYLLKQMKENGYID